MALFNIVVFVAAAVCVMSAVDIPAGWKAQIKVLHDKCQPETGVSEDHIENAKNGIFADDNLLKCYMKCLMVKSYMMSEDGVFNAKFVIALIPAGHKEALIPTINKCKSVVGTDPCDTAFLLNKCWYENNPEYYLIA